MSFDKVESVSQLSIIPIVVTYHPDINKLQALLSSLLSQVEQVIIVDNTSSGNLVNSLVKFDLGKIELISQTENYGLANAMNVGIMRALELSATHIAMFDQDSLPTEDMLQTLLSAQIKLEKQGKKVAAVGPRFFDSRSDSNTLPFVTLKGFRVIKYQECQPQLIISVDRLISSGSLISVKVLEDVGLMNKSLFIDYVDTEWGLRAISKGYELFGVCDAVMEHELGEDPLLLFGKKLPLHSPLRNYYQLRNGCYVFKQHYTTLGWKFTDGYRMILKYMVYSIFAKPRLKRLRMMSTGILHAFSGKMGKYENL